MSQDALERQRRRELRGAILRTARIVYGKSPDAMEIRSFMHIAGRHEFAENDMREELQYCVDMGYLEKLTRKIDRLDKDPVTKWRLTAKGMQILNGDAEDQSVEV